MEGGDRNGSFAIWAAIIIAVLIVVAVVVAIVAGSSSSSSSRDEEGGGSPLHERFIKYDKDALPPETPVVKGRGRAGPHVATLDSAQATTPSAAASPFPPPSSSSTWRWFGGSNGSAPGGGGMTVYADNNATTQMFRETADALLHANAEFYANPSSIHAAGRRSAQALEESREQIAAMIGARPQELYFTSGATESNNLAIRGIMRASLSPGYCSMLAFGDDIAGGGEKKQEEEEEVEEEEEGGESDRGGGSEEERQQRRAMRRLREAARSDRKRLRKGACRRKIVTTPIEHASVYETVATVAPEVEVLRVNVDRRGLIDVAHFETLVRDPAVAMACVIVANNEIGTMQDVPRLSRACRRHGVHLHCDMTQVFGKYAVDLEALGADSATMSAHKFHGPKGIGALYVREGAWVDNAVMTGGAQEGALRAGTENIAGVYAMTAALRRCAELRALGRDREVRGMRDAVRRALVDAVPGLVVNGDERRGLYNTLSVCLPEGMNSRALIPVLDELGVYVNTGCACSKGQGSATLRALGLNDRRISGSLRISLSFLTTEEQCRTLIAAVLHGLHVMRGAGASSSSS